MKKVNTTRRQFLKNTATIVGGTLLAPHILSSCSKGANDKVLVAHIGVGNRGARELEQYFLPLESAFSVATCDPHLNRREERAALINETYKKQERKAPKCKSYLDFKEILERPDIDAVNIVTPDHWHVLAAIRAARAGKHVMLAKPLGLSYPNYKTLAKELKANGVHFHYGTQQRVMEHMRVGVDMIKEGKIGEIEKIDVWCPGKNPVESPVCNEVPVPDDFDYDLWTGPAPLNPYCPERVTNNSSWFQWDYSIGFLAGWGAHPLDIMIWALKDKMDGVYSCEGTGTFWNSGGIYDNIYSWDLNYQFKSGINLHFLSVDRVKENNIWEYRNKKDNNATTFWGSKGWISLSRGSAESNVPEIQKKFDEFEANRPNDYVLSSSDSMGQAFIDIIKGKSEEICPLSDAIISDGISHMGNIAIRTGRKVTWDPAKEKVLNDQEANSLFIRDMREPYTP